MATKTFNEVKINVAFTEAANPSGQTHAGNIDGSTGTGHEHGQDLATTLGIIKNWYSHWHSVVWTGDAASVSGYTIGKPVPSDAVFTDTTYTLSGAYGSSNNTWVTTLTPSSGTATTSTVPTASTSVYGITKLSSSTSSTSTSLAATPSAVKSAYDLASGKSTVAFSASLSSGTKIGTITIDGTDTDIYCLTGDTYSAGTGLTMGTGNVINHSNSVTAVTTAGFLKVKYDAQGHVTGSSAVVKADITALGIPGSDTTYSAGTGLSLSGTTINHSNSVDAVTTAGFLKVKYDAQGHITGSSAVAKSDITGLGIPGSNTTYTFAEGSTNGAFSVTPSGGSAQTVSIHGLSSAAYAATTDFTAAKPDGTHDLVDSTTHLINSEYLPSYVDDIIEGYYNSADGKFYTTRTGTSPNYSYSGEITGESGKIYLDIGVTPAEAYRWGGSAYASLKQPTISAIADVVQKSNGVITKSYTDGTASADVTVYTHPTTAGNKHIPSGGSAGKFLGWSSSGTATWQDVPAVAVYQGATASAAGVTGTVPAAAAGQNSAHYLRGDGTWSNDPVIEADTLVLNVVAAS